MQGISRRMPDACASCRLLPTAFSYVVSQNRSTENRTNEKHTAVQHYAAVCLFYLFYIVQLQTRRLFPVLACPPLCCPKGQRTAGIFRFMAHPEREGTVFYESFFYILTAVFRLYRSMNETCKIRFPVKGVLCCDCVFYQRRRAPQLYSASFYLFWQACLRTT